MWKKIPECRNHPYCPLMEKRKEHRVYLIFDYHEGGDNLPMTSARYMTQEVGREILQQEMAVARRLEKREVVVTIKGGDPSNRFQELRALCEWGWEAASKEAVELRFEVTLDVDHFAAEHGDWYVEHAEQLILWARCRGKNPKALEFAKVFGGGIVYEMDVKRPKDVVPQLFQIQRLGVPIEIQLITQPEDWSEETQNQYDELVGDLMKYLPEPEKTTWMAQLQRIEAARSGEAGDSFYGRCYDTNGWQWTCPALSQLHLYSWDMEEDRLEGIIHGEPKEAFRWACPGEMLKWKAENIYLQHKQMAEYTHAAVCAVKTSDSVRKREMIGLMSEAAQREGEKDERI